MENEWRRSGRRVEDDLSEDFSGDSADEMPKGYMTAAWVGMSRTPERKDSKKTCCFQPFFTNSSGW